MQRNASKLAALAAVAIASLVYSGVRGEARQAPQQGAGGGRGGRGAAPAAAPADAELHILHVQGNVHMLVGAGGNIALQVGDDGVLLVDTGLAANAERVVAAIRTTWAATTTSGSWGARLPAATWAQARAWAPASSRTKTS